MISSVYQTVKLSLVGEVLGLSGAELTAFIKEAGWTEENGMIRIPKNENNEIKPAVTQESIKFERAWQYFHYCFEANFTVANRVHQADRLDARQLGDAKITKNVAGDQRRGHFDAPFLLLVVNEPTLCT